MYQYELKADGTFGFPYGLTEIAEKVRTENGIDYVWNVTGDNTIEIMLSQGNVIYLELDDGYLKTTDDYGQIFLAPVDKFTYADY